MSGIEEQIQTLFTIGMGDFDDRVSTAIDMTNATGAIKTKTFDFPVAPIYFGFRVVVDFVYQAQTAEGKMGLYLYPQGSTANKVLLGYVTFTDKLAAGQVVRCRVPVQPAAGISGGHAKDVVPNLLPGDQLGLWIMTRAVGSSYAEGTFQPYIVCQYIGKTLADQTNVVDQTPASTGIPSTQ